MTWKEKVYRDVELARAAGERLDLARALLALGFYEFAIDQPEEASKYAEEAGDLLKQIGSYTYDPQYLFAAMAWRNGEYQEAKAIYMDIQTHLGLLGEKNNRSAAVGLLGSLALDEGDFGQAQIFLEESLATARELQNHFFIVSRLIDLGSLYYLEGNAEEYKRKYREGLSVAKKLTLVEKFDCLFFALRPLNSQAAHDRVSVLGALHHCQRETEIPFDPILKRFYDRAEAHARHVLGDEAFQAAFAEGQKLSLDEALDLALKMVEEI